MDKEATDSQTTTPNMNQQSTMVVEEDILPGGSDQNMEEDQNTVGDPKRNDNQRKYKHRKWRKNNRNPMDPVRKEMLDHLFSTSQAIIRVNKALLDFYYANKNCSELFTNILFSLKTSKTLAILSKRHIETLLRS